MPPVGKDVWVAPLPASNELLVCTSVRGDQAAQLCNAAADYVFNGTPHSRTAPLQYASCLRLPVRPADPIPLPPEGTRCKLVWPPKRWWPGPIPYVPVAFSLVVTRHSDWRTAQFFIEAHIGDDYMKGDGDGDGRRDLYGSDLRYLRPLAHLDGMLESFTGAVVTTMVRCARPGGLLQNGAELGIADGVAFVRDKLGRGYDVDGEVVFDMKLPSSSRRIITTHDSPYFIPLATDAELDEAAIRTLVRQDKMRSATVSRFTA